MTTFHVACEERRGPCFSETVEAPDEKTAKRLVAAHAAASGFCPTIFKAKVVPAGA